MSMTSELNQNQFVNLGIYLNNTMDSSLKFIQAVNKAVSDLKQKIFRSNLPPELAFIENDLNGILDLTLSFRIDTEVQRKVNSALLKESLVTNAVSQSYKGQNTPKSIRTTATSIKPQKRATNDIADVRESKKHRGDFEKEGDWTTVFIDGACSANGRSNAKAGIGVWFYANCPYNVSEPVRGRRTNNVAEIEASIKAIQQANAAGIKKLRVKTDSMFLINCITKWRFAWKKNGWKTAAGKPVINKTEVVALGEVLDDLPITVDWVHVKAHSGIIGNEAADALAVAGAKISV